MSNSNYRLGFQSTEGSKERQHLFSQEVLLTWLLVGGSQSMLAGGDRHSFPGGYLHGAACLVTFLRVSHRETREEVAMISVT